MHWSSWRLVHDDFISNDEEEKMGNLQSHWSWSKSSGDDNIFQSNKKNYLRMCDISCLCKSLHPFT